MTPLPLDVALTPALLQRTPGTRTVSILVDALRATSTLATLFALGARSVELPPGLRQARDLAARGRPVAAEAVSGVQARGCHLPVSPSRLDPASVRGRDVVFCTTNGTRAARLAVRRSDEVLFGSLLNASAVAEQALRLAGGDGRVVVVCAGRQWNRVPCLDDAYAAGVLAHRVARLAAEGGRPVRRSDAASIAMLVADAYPDPYAALSRSATADILRRARSADDIAFCARLDVTPVVPTLARCGASSPACPVTLTNYVLEQEAA